jgi:two-component system, cell cycle response regulator DivK
LNNQSFLKFMVNDMERILLVEDNEMNMDMLSRRLRRQGYEVVTAVDGKQALEKATTDTPPDLILMDLSLPEMDGWEATQYLKKNDKTKQIPIIILTAHALKTDREMAFQIGCDDYDVKPVDFPRLLEKIEKQLNKGKVS